MAKLTPMMKQYQEIKSRYQDAILFFRLGDFYEMFNDDARIAARELEIALTSRNKGKGEKVPMAGVPHHSADSYIADLIDRGYKVAICEQLEDPAEANGLVERDVVRVITPGTVLNSQMLKEKKNNFLAAAVKHDDRWGFSYIDISTGEFFLTEMKEADEKGLLDEITRIEPAELIICDKFKERKDFREFIDSYFSRIQIDELPSYFPLSRAEKLLEEHFGTAGLVGFGCAEMKAGIKAAAGILDFLYETQKCKMKNINSLATYSTANYMVLDSATRNNLELVRNIRTGGRKGSLLGILDQTVTAMGGRMLKTWLTQPLISVEEIDMRLAAVDELYHDQLVTAEIQEYLTGVYDIERLIGKIAYGSANARDMVALKKSLGKLPLLKELLTSSRAIRLREIQQELDPLDDITSLLDRALVEEPPVSLREGGLIANGYHARLDELRQASKEGRDWIARLEKQEKDRTGIKSLKVGFNKVFGYYIGVTNPNLDKVPQDYTRKQTLSNSERFITPELKEKEALILGADEKSIELEYQLFVEIREEVAEQLDRIKKSARLTAELDVLSALARVAVQNNYCRPQIDTSDRIFIKDGRHPVVEAMTKESFVPNDTVMDNAEERFIIITGPNMSGKSTYLRQTALITLMAQIGSFVPATEAKIGIVDRIFTRVGASDDLTTGQSTFMVEMNEVANIINHATRRSLIILDEVGRGTSTFDGLSLAWAITEYIHNPARIGAKTLFATHYHELTVLEEKLQALKNYNVAVEKRGEEITFLRKIVSGGTDDSYGIEVARLAGLPGEILKRATAVLAKLEKGEHLNNGSGVNQENSQDIAGDTTPAQLLLFNPAQQIIEEILELDIARMTPIEAINRLYQLRQKVEETLDTREKEA
ncbi:MAG: DNA mismatch repair protein MutS [Halanaerobium sp.]|nr:DNA mismatch repair protein MutS [Halanaerobium sp.]